MLLSTRCEIARLWSVRSARRLQPFLPYHHPTSTFAHHVAACCIHVDLSSLLTFLLCAACMYAAVRVCSCVSHSPHRRRCSPLLRCAAVLSHPPSRVECARYVRVVACGASMCVCLLCACVVSVREYLPLPACLPLPLRLRAATAAAGWSSRDWLLAAWTVLAHARTVHMCVCVKEQSSGAWAWAGGGVYMCADRGRWERGGRTTCASVAHSHTASLPATSRVSMQMEGGICLQSAPCSI